MGNLLVNMRDQQFVLFEQLNLEKIFASEKYGDYTKEDIKMIIDEAEKMAVNEIFPTLKEGEVGCELKDGQVHVPKCFHEPWKKFTEAGWISPMDSPDVGRNTSRFLPQRLKRCHELPSKLKCVS